MFRNTKAFSGFSIDDLQKAREFYGDILGLEVTESEMNCLELHIAGSNNIIIYPKPNHTAASFTILNFPVEKIEEKVQALKDKGVRFESYDEEYLKTDEDHICRQEGIKIAWFKDPSGNILSVLEES